MSGSQGMQGLGATGTGYQGNTGNSLLQQLILQHMMGGGSSYSPTSNPLSGVMGGAGAVTNNPMSGMIGANQRVGGMNPQVQAQPVQMQGNTGGTSALGGANLQQLMQVIQNQQRQQQGGLTPTTGQTPNPQTAGNTGLFSGLGNWLQGNPWSTLTPENLRSQLGITDPKQQMP